MNGNGTADEKSIEPIVVLLVALVIFFTFALLAVAKWMSSDGQTFQIIAGLVTGFSGALLMRVKPKNTPDDGIPLPAAPTKVHVHATTDTTAETTKEDK